MMVRDAIQPLAATSGVCRTLAFVLPSSVWYRMARALISAVSMRLEWTWWSRWWCDALAASSTTVIHSEMKRCARDTDERGLATIPLPLSGSPIRSVYRLVHGLAYLPRTVSSYNLLCLRSVGPAAAVSAFIHFTIRGFFVHFFSVCYLARRASAVNSNDAVCGRSSNNSA